MPQLMPSIQLFLHTGRGASASINNFLDIKTHLIRLIAPTIYGNDVLGDRYRGQFNYPETSIYFGVLALFFIFSSIFAPKRRYVWGLFGIGAFTLLAVYNIFPFSQITSVIFPIFLNVFPGRIFYVVVFTWSIAAGLGADWLVEECPKNILRWMSLFLSAFL